MTFDLNLPDTDEIAESISPYGNVDNGIQKSKPSNESGLIQYIWRMARFHSGADTHMPVTAYWWLQDYLDSNGIDASVTGIHDEAGKEIMNKIDDTVTEVVREEFGESDLEAAKRWHEAGLV